jgi:hypothetical protein
MLVTYKKTATGQAELDHRSSGLRPELRRLLILIDGKRSVAALAPLFRANELEGLIDELIAFDMIKATSNATSFLPDPASGNKTPAPLDRQQLSAAIAAAKTGVKEMLGRDTKEFLQKLDSCADSKSLRLVVSEIQFRLIAEVGDDAATAFVVHIRNATRP